MSTKHGVIWVVGLCLAGANGCSIPCDPGYYREGNWCIRYEPDGGDAAVGDSAIPDTSAPNDSGADACTTILFRDEDGDGYGDPSGFEFACRGTPGFVGEAGDCDDNNRNVYPAAREVCNDIDDDCDLATDEGLRVDCYADGDGDGTASTQSAMRLCVTPTGECPAGFSSTRPTTIDCNDRNPCASTSCTRSIQGERRSFLCSSTMLGTYMHVVESCPFGFSASSCEGEMTYSSNASCQLVPSTTICSNQHWAEGTFNWSCVIATGTANCRLNYTCIADPVWTGRCAP